ncbi:MAG TPA: Rrf2 family transcriptional regulator [Solibacterales bacterium]|nr:Rrf2 family transcriptional regulator [Bryobacterales bacterium]
MQITRSADYALRVMIHLAGQPPGARTSRETLAQWTEAPSEFLSKVLQALTRARLIQSHRGMRGGFALARDGAEITALHVLEAIEGPLQLNVCLAQDPQCGRRWWCAGHDLWKNAQAAMAQVLTGATMAQLARDSFQRKGLTQVEVSPWN